MPHTKTLLFCVILLVLAIWMGLFSNSTGVRNPQPSLAPFTQSWRGGEVTAFFDEKALQMVEQTLSDATATIDMEMYLIGGEYGTRILTLLDEKARQGVRVRLLHGTGGLLTWATWLKKKLPDQFTVRNRDHRSGQPHYIPVADSLFATKLADSKIERAEFPLQRFAAPGLNPMGWAHDKIIVVDGQIAIVGGMNLATAVSNNHDVLLRVSGPAVKPVADVFAYDWRLATGENAPPTDDAIGNADNLTDTVPGGDRAQLQFKVTRPHLENQYDGIIAAIDEARRRIWVQMYCLTHTGIIEKLIAARKRGIDVRLLLDANEYSLGLRLKGAPNLAFCQQYLNAGIRVRIYRSAPGHQMHQKSMLVDDDIVMVGATNYTRQSFRVNTESMFVVKSTQLAAIFEDRFLHDWCFCSDDPDTEAMASRRHYYRLARWFSRFI